MALLTTLYGGFQDYWNLYHKVTFEPLEKLIIINSDTTSINVQVDLYSASKEWQKLENNLRWRRPMRAAGGDPIPGGKLGSTYFVTNGWRIYIDHAVNFVGNLYSDDFSSPFLVAPGVNLVTTTVSNLVDFASVPSADQNAAAVWNALLASYIAAGTAGKAVNDINTKTTKIEKTVNDNQALILSK